ncbi:T cell receptor alpha chain MC.7.G5-like [Carettochelys insculpta]|uniref:T cell receptor alpha chain MC.7.G5-like n=1 Tax=Carettochelys insculpta TaxID=44489 RepID=UPI003EB77BB9
MVRGNQGEFNKDECEGLRFGRGAWAQYTVTQDPAQAGVQEGEPIQLNCSYTGTMYSIQWYRQPPGSRPQFVALRSSSGRDTQENYTMSLDTASQSSFLYLNSSRLADSAVYLCQPGGQGKWIFGSGTQLLVIPDLPDSEPSIYPLNAEAEDTKWSACLITDFSPGSLLVGDSSPPQEDVNASIVEVKSEGKCEASYGTVLWKQQEELTCFVKHNDRDFSSTTRLEEEDSCMVMELDEAFETDEKLNLLSFTMLGLRIVFVKAVGVNLLLTFRAWKR